MSNSHFNWDKLVFVLQQQDCILVTGSAISTGKAEDNTERPLTEMLASNFKSNIDDAFLRRFQSIIHFPMPKAAERLAIWVKPISGRELRGNFTKKEKLSTNLFFQ